MGPAETDERAAHAHAGPRRGVRREAWMGATGLLPDWTRMAPRRRRSALFRLHTSAVLRPARRRAPRLPGPRRDDRYELIRQGRDHRPRGSAAARAGRGPLARETGGIGCVHAAAREER